MGLIKTHHLQEKLNSSFAGKTKFILCRRNKTHHLQKIPSTSFTICFVKFDGTNFPKLTETNSKDKAFMSDISRRA